MRRSDVSLHDWHIYGGLFLIGLKALAAYPPAGPIIVGVSLFYLGLRRPLK